MINNNPVLRRMWQQAGFTEDPARVDPNEVRQRVSTYRDQLLASSGQAPQGMPTTYANTPGVGGLGYQTVASGKDVGKISTFGEQKLPGYTLQKTHDIETGKDYVTPLVTQPGGVTPPAALFGAGVGGGVAQSPSVLRTAAGLGPAPASVPGGPAPAAGRAGVGSQAGTPFDIGYEPPKEPEREAARLATYAKQANDTLLNQEGSGYVPGLKARTLMIQAATAGDMSNVDQFMKQVSEKVSLSPQDRQYMTAIFPVLQTMIHKLTPRMSPTSVNAMLSAAIPTG
jgi:hypothetical protein